MGVACGLLAAQTQQPDSKATAQTPKQKQAGSEKTAGKPQLPFQIQLLESQVRFEANGDSRKEVHTIVKIINILGVQQFGRISFDYDRSFQKVEIPLIRVSHPNGGTSEVLPSAIADVPNQATEQFPAYQDARVKAARILGLQEGDTVEYRVITTTTKQPLAPDFWIEHTFDRSGQVLEEHYELDVPASRKVEPQINLETPVTSKDEIGAGDDAFVVYRWKRTYSPAKDAAGNEEPAPATPEHPDVELSSLTWESLAIRLAELMLPGSEPITQAKNSISELNRRPTVTPAVRDKALALTREAKTDVERLRAIYKFVSTQINTVDLPLGASGFRARAAEDVMNSGYATSEDKYVLFGALATAVDLHVDPALTGFCDKKAVALPGVFRHLVVIGYTRQGNYWLDPTVEVAPFGMITPAGAKCALFLSREVYTLRAAGREWIEVPAKLPFAAFQTVNVDATITKEGALTARVRYVVRGENELLLRVAFHQSPKDKWKDIANLLAISDGFRGQITNAQASDPLSTEDAFEVEYDLTQLKFVDWSKKPARIPALLPQIGLPDLPEAPGTGKTAPTIELGTPLNVETSMTLHLPEGTTVETPAGTSVARDYATYDSKYSSSQNTAVASRHINFLKREILGDRAMDYNAFVRAVQNDQGQRLVLLPPASLGDGPKAPADNRR
jgi:Domain of Unknown Function with PDB structure (DUF3857)